jgi:hypothetical protein
MQVDKLGNLLQVYKYTEAAGIYLDFEFDTLHRYTYNSHTKIFD